MKTAFLIPQFYPHIGGAEICAHNVCVSLLKAGHEPVVVTTSPPPEKQPELGYEVVYLSKYTGGLFRRASGIGKFYLQHCLAALQKKHDFDIWQVIMGYPLGAYAVDFFKKKNIPCVLRCCGDDIQKYPEIAYGSRLDKRVDELVTEKYPLFDGMIALTKSVKHEYAKLGIEDSKIRIIPNGVNCEKFKSRKNESARAKVRAELGINDGAALILTVGRYHPKKGYDLIPSIARELKGKGFDFKWVIVGKQSGEIIGKFPECDELGIQAVEKFAFTGGDVFSLPSEGLIDLYCSADIFVLPTLMETFGMVLVEAMAAGLPIVTTDAPGVKDVVDHKKNGLKAPAGDAKAIAELIAGILRNKTLAENLSKTALAEASKRYDWKIVTDSYIDFYRDIIKKQQIAD